MNEQTPQEIAEVLMLLVMNDRRVHEQSIMPIRKNLMRKRAKGTYDGEKAKTAWMHAVEMGARNEARRIGRVWHQLFSIEVRRMVAKVMAEQFEIEALGGEWDDLIKKEVRS